MRRHSVDQFMYQNRIAMHITGRDTRKRIASMFMMIGVVIWSGASARGGRGFSDQLLRWIG